jgi:hypothetical protein
VRDGEEVVVFRAVSLVGGRCFSFIYISVYMEL